MRGLAVARRYAVPLLAVGLLVSVVLVLAAADRLTGSEGRHPAGRTMLVGSTLIGNATDSGTDAIETLIDESGKPQIVRIFYPSLPEDWATVNAKVDNLPTMISFKASPQQVLAGGYDHFFTEWFATAPTDRP